MTPIDHSTHEDLSAYIDGELPPERAALLAASLRTDPALAQSEAALRRDRDLLAQAYAPLAREPLPAAWLARIEAAVDRNPQAARAPSDGAAMEPAAIEAAQPISAAAVEPGAKAAMRPGAAVATARGADILPFQTRKPRGAVRAVAAPPVWARWAAAACLALVFGAAVLLRAPAGDPLLRQATLARTGQSAPLTTLADAALPPLDRQRALMRQATGLPVRAPDLRRLGWQLAALTTYPGAAQLRYRNTAGATLTMYVRRSTGAPHFDLLRDGKLRVCVWQDEVVGAVIMGEMQAGQMMRVAGAAYADLDL